MIRKVRFRFKADEDMQRIYAWISQSSATGAERWFTALQETVDRLAVNAMHHGYAAENRQFDFELRQCFFKTSKGRRYRILYIVDGNEVQILRIRGPGQPPVTKHTIGY